MKVAAIQMTSTRDVRANLVEAGRLLGEAAARGAELAVLPENFSFMGATEAEKIAAVERDGDGPAQAFLAEQAEKHRLFLVGGTIHIRDPGPMAARSLATTRSTCSTSTSRVARRSVISNPRARAPAPAS